MTSHPRTRPDIEARALAMHATGMSVDDAAAMLRVPIMRIIDGRPTIVRPGAES